MPKSGPLPGESRRGGPAIPGRDPAHSGRRDRLQGREEVLRGPDPAGGADVEEAPGGRAGQGRAEEPESGASGRPEAKRATRT